MNLTQIMALGYDDFIIQPSNLQHPNQSFGCIPRTTPIGFGAGSAPFDLPLMTDDEIEAAIKRKDADNSWLDNIRNYGMYGAQIPSRDQNGKGYCWAHSTTSAMLLTRARDNQPFADLSAYAIACILKSYQDQGGWGSESLDFAVSRGVPTSQFWAQQSMSRSNDNTNTWANAALHKVSEYMDGEPRNIRQLATALCNNIAAVTDFNWWSHSVCGARVLAWGPNGSNFRLRIWNSWGDSYKVRGMGDLVGNQAIPDGLCFPRVIVASAA